MTPKTARLDGCALIDGRLLDLERHQPIGSSSKDFGMSLIFGAGAVGIGIAAEGQPFGSPWIGIAKGLAVAFAIVTCIGVPQGLAKAMSMTARGARASRQIDQPSRFAAIVVALLAMSTAVVNLLGAFAKR